MLWWVRFCVRSECWLISLNHHIQRIIDLVVLLSSPTASSVCVCPVCVKAGPDPYLPS